MASLTWHAPTQSSPARSAARARASPSATAVSSPYSSSAPRLDMRRPGPGGSDQLSSPIVVTGRGCRRHGLARLPSTPWRASTRPVLCHGLLLRSDPFQCVEGLVPLGRNGVEVPFCGPQTGVAKAFADGL